MNVLKKIPSYVIVIVIFAIVIFSLKEIELLYYTKSKETCGYFYKKSCSQSECYFHYKFVIDGNESSGSLSIRDCKIKSIDVLKKNGVC